MARWYTAEDWAFMHATGTPPPRHELVAQPSGGRVAVWWVAVIAVPAWALLCLIEGGVSAIFGVELLIALAVGAVPMRRWAHTSPGATTRRRDVRVRWWATGAVAILVATAIWGVALRVDQPPATSAIAARPAAQAVTPGPAPIPDSTSEVTVKRVIDGDTIELADGTRVRILGIDSCEMSTPAGPRAKEDLNTYISGVYTQLVAEPGVDRDQYGRLLRYVKAIGTDVGKHMVSSTHTGVYAGRNDANPTYLAELRAADTDGRDCTDPDGILGGTTPDNDTAYVPVPNNDDDHHESRFCRKRRWC